jgi:hypothetical protein
MIFNTITLLPRSELFRATVSERRNDGVCGSPVLLGKDWFRQVKITVRTSVVISPIFLLLFIPEVK